MPELAARLAALEARDLRRTLKLAEGRDLTSNDALGLSTHPAVRDALIAALQAGVPHGGNGSRLLSGQHQAWVDLEAEVAAWQGTEAALFHATGFAANSGLLACLPEADDVVISDALNHASLIDGIRQSRATRKVVPHDDVEALRRTLAEPRKGQAWVVIESVYSMDGTALDLTAYAQICAEHHARLIVDEAHATGIYGPRGEGRVVGQGVRDGVFATIHPCGKAIGQAGAFICGSQDLIDWLINRSRPFVFSTAPPPYMAAGLAAAIGLVQANAPLRATPLRLAKRFRDALARRANIPHGHSHIVPVIVGTAARALAMQAFLASKGWDARAIRPPTVPEGTSRVRFVLNARLTEDDVDALAHDVLAFLGA